MSDFQSFNYHHGGVSIKIDLNRLKLRFNKAQNDLNNQIILDTMGYVPFQQGILSNSVHVENSDEIVWNTPYARFLYAGKVMVDERGSTYAKKGGKKYVTNTDLKYSQESHSKAGSYWFERSKNDHLDGWIETVKKAVK